MLRATLEGFRRRVEFTRAEWLSLVKSFSIGVKTLGLGNVVPSMNLTNDREFRRTSSPVLANSGATHNMPCKACKGKVDIQDLSSPYTIHTCPKCGREIKLREPGNHGRGIRIEKGDRFVFPDGWLKLSPHPLKGTGAFSRHGLDWFAQLTFVESLLQRQGEIEKILQENDQYCLGMHQKSELVKDLDPGKPEHADELFQRLTRIIRTHSSNRPQRAPAMGWGPLAWSVRELSPTPGV